jgi:hypothetical protein
MLIRLNGVRDTLQLLFMSDILTASGNKINPVILSQRPNEEAWSDMRWPNKQLTESDYHLWRKAMISICPSRRGTGKVGRFISLTHRIWRWTWNTSESTLYHLNKDGTTEDVFILGRKPNRFHYSHSQPSSHHQMIYSVKPTLGGGPEALARPTQPPTCFLDVLQLWGNTWLWDHLTVTGSVAWLSKSSAQNTLVAVNDGSYICELYPHLCSAAYVLECS